MKRDADFLKKVRELAVEKNMSATAIPQYIFEELAWNKGDKVLIRRSGKNKIIIEKPVS